MSTTKVNLLPREVEERVRARRLNQVAVGLLVGYIGVLGGLYGLKLNDVNQAREERDTAQAEVARLEARVAELEQYKQLANKREARNGILAHAMANEVAWARILNDVALAFPTSASMTDMQAEFNPVEAQPGAVDFGPELGNLAFKGYSVERYAPGVESVLLGFEKVHSFFNVFLSVGNTAENNKTEFETTADLDESILTKRYVNGLPPEEGQ